MCRTVNFDNLTPANILPDNIISTGNVTFSRFNSVTEDGSSIVGVVSPPGALINIAGSAYITGYGTQTFPIDLRSLYMTAIGSNVTVTINGIGKFDNVVKNLTTHLVANVVTYMPLSGFVNLMQAEILTGADSDRFLLDNVVVRRSS